MVLGLAIYTVNIQQRQSDILHKLFSSIKQSRIFFFQVGFFLIESMQGGKLI